MSKSSKIKWRDNDITELQRVVKNFNAKLTRLEKKYPDVKEFLPDRLSSKELKTKIETRQDFNRELNSIKRFSRKGQENLQTTPTGLTLTKYEVNEAKIKTRIVNQKRTNEARRLGLSVQSGTMGQIESQGLKPKNFSLNKSPKEWDKFVESLDKEIRTNFKKEQFDKYKENYLKAIERNLGSLGQELMDLLKGMDSEKLYKNSVGNPLLSIDFVYEPQEMEVIAETKLELWNDIMDE